MQINNHFEVKQHCLKGKKRKGKNPRCSRPEVRDFSGWSTQSDDRAQGPYLPPPPPPGTCRARGDPSSPAVQEGQAHAAPREGSEAAGWGQTHPPHTRPAPLSGQQTIVDVPSYRPAPPTCGKSPSPPLSLSQPDRAEGTNRASPPFPPSRPGARVRVRSRAGGASQALPQAPPCLASTHRGSCRLPSAEGEGQYPKPAAPHREPETPPATQPL